MINKKDTTYMNILADVLKTVLKPLLEKYLAARKERKELERFYNTLISLSDKYISEHETEAVAHSEFADYVQRYNLYEHLFEFIESPQPISETEFINSQAKKATEYVRKKHIIGITDHSIKEYIQASFDLIKKFYTDKLDYGQTYTIYEIQQAVMQGNTALLNKLTPLLTFNSVRLPETSAAEKQAPQKRNYSYDPTLITRTVTTSLNVDVDIWGNIINNSSDTLMNFCQTSNHIVLLGDAGCGKTIELNQLAGWVSKNRPSDFPLIYELDNYIDASIPDILKEAGYDSIPAEYLFLIFDGFDEIQNEHRNNFARRIEDFAKKNPQTHIVISSRSNSYRFANNEGRGSTFDGFTEIYLNPLEPKDIDNYVVSNGLVTSDFWKETSDKSLNEIVYNPFYLKTLVAFMKATGNLPTPARLMDEIIQNRFEEDATKYHLTINLDEKKPLILGSLCKIAFAMQCMQKKSIDVRVCYGFSSAEDIECTKYSGILVKKSNDAWVFEHNNFREYLAAKYLSELDVETIRQIIFDTNHKVKDSWLNVLSFLVALYPNDSLLNLIAETDIEIFVKFEQDRLNDAERFRIFESVFNSYKEKNVWITRSRLDIEAFAKFGQTKESCEFLLSEISSYTNHFRSLSNAIHILSHFTKYFSLESKIREVLFNVLKRTDVRIYEKKDAIAAIVNLNLSNEEITNYLIASMPENCNCYSGEILQYLIATNNHEANIDLFLRQLKASHTRSDDGYSGTISYYVKKALQQVKSFDSVSKSLVFLASADYLYSTEKEVFDNLFEQAEILFRNGNMDIVNTIFECAKISAKKFTHNVTQRCKEFFVKTKTIVSIFKKLLDLYVKSDDYNVLFLLEDFATEECYLFLRTLCGQAESSYIECLKKLTFRMSTSENGYSENVSLLTSYGIVIPEPTPRIDYSLESQKGAQAYFDSLFDEEEYHKLIIKLLEYIDNPDITFEDFEKCIHLRDFDDRALGQTLLQVSIDVDNLKRKDTESIKVVDWKSAISDWTWYSIGEIYNALHRNEKISISTEQRIYIEAFCKKHIGEIDFSRETKDLENGGFWCSPRLQIIVALSSKLNIDYSKEIFYKFMLVPSFIIDHNTTAYYKFSEYITNHMTNDELQLAVIQNISTTKMCFDAAHTHLDYCKEHNLNNGVDLAISLISNKTASEFVKRAAFEYLLAFKEIDYLYEKYLDSKDTVVFKCLVETTSALKHPLLKSKLESLNRDSENKTEYLSLLISMNSKYGLQVYYSEAKSKMEILGGTNAGDYSPLNEAISTVSDVELLPELLLLQELVFTEGFKDKSHFGLYNSIYHAYQNIAKANYEKVYTWLSERLTISTISHEEKCFCNTLLDEISQSYAMYIDKPWDIREITSFIKKANFTYY